VTRDKARYVGDDTGTLVPDFSESLRGELHRLYKHHFNVERVAVARSFAQGFGDPNWRTAEATDALVQSLLFAADPLKVTLFRRKTFALKKGEIQAEYGDLDKTLKAASAKLRSVSAELDRLLGKDADVLGVANSLDALLVIIQRASLSVKMAPGRKTGRVFDNQVALQLIVALAEVCLAHGLPISASAQGGRASQFIRATKLIADAMGLVLSEKTWTNIASQAGRRQRRAD
jgi:hypothetical protein